MKELPKKESRAQTYLNTKKQRSPAREKITPNTSIKIAFLPVMLSGVDSERCTAVGWAVRKVATGHMAFRWL